MRCGLYRTRGDAIKILTKQPSRGIQTWLRSPRRRFYSLVAIKTEYTGKKKGRIIRLSSSSPGLLHTRISLLHGGALRFSVTNYFIIFSSGPGIVVVVYCCTLQRIRWHVRTSAIRPSSVRRARFIFACPYSLDRFVSAVFTHLYVRVCVKRREDLCYTWCKGLFRYHIICLSTRRCSRYHRYLSAFCRSTTV